MCNYISNFYRSHFGSRFPVSFIDRKMYNINILTLSGNIYDTISINSLINTYSDIESIFKNKYKYNSDGTNIYYKIILNGITIYHNLYNKEYILEYNEINTILIDNDLYIIIMSFNKNDIIKIKNEININNFNHIYDIYEILQDDDVNIILYDLYKKENNYILSNMILYGIRHNIKLIKQIINCNYHCLSHANEIIQECDEIFKVAVMQDGYLLQYASRRLQNNNDIVKLAVEQDGIALRFASYRLKNCYYIVKIAVTQNGTALQYANPRLKDCDDIVKLAFIQNYNSFQYASNRLKDCDDFVKLAFIQKYNSLHYASNRLKDCDKFIKLLVKENYNSFQYASNRLKDCDEFIKLIFKENYNSLQYASDKSFIVQYAKDIINFVQYASNRIQKEYRYTCLVDILNTYSYTLKYGTDSEKEIIYNRIYNIINKK